MWKYFAYVDSSAHNHTHVCVYTCMCTNMNTRNRGVSWWYLRELGSKPKDFRPWLYYLLAVRSKFLRMVFKPLMVWNIPKSESQASSTILSCMCPQLQPEQAFKVPGMSLVHSLFYTGFQYPLLSQAWTCLHTHFCAPPTQSLYGSPSLSLNLSAPYFCLIPCGPITGLKPLVAVVGIFSNSLCGFLSH